MADKDAQVSETDESKIDLEDEFIDDDKEQSFYESPFFCFMCGTRMYEDGIAHCCPICGKVYLPSLDSDLGTQSLTVCE